MLSCLQVLELDEQIQKIAETLKDEASLLVFGRGHNYATALETALKVTVLIYLTCSRQNDAFTYMSIIDMLAPALS